MYSAFAPYYDRLMEDFPYAELIEELESSGPVQGRVLEMGCGSGRATALLYPKCREYWALDPSEEMLTLAARRLGSPPGLHLMQEAGDPFPPELDAVVAAVDVVNYMSEEELLSFLRRSLEALKDGGRLLFDVSSEEKLRGTLGEQVFFYDYEDFSLVWENSFSEEERGVYFDLTLFIRQGGNYVKETEQHFQRARDEAEIKELLRSEGYSQIASREKGERLFFSGVCRKG